MPIPCPKALFHRFRHNRNGHFAVSFALASTVIFMAVGLAVDFSLSLSTKARINNALDAAALATGRALSIGEIGETGTEAEDYFKAVFAANIGDDAFDSSTYQLKQFAIDTSDESVSVQMSVNQSLTFSRIGTGKNALAVASKSAVNYRTGSIEVAMVLDVTGSMGSGSGSRLDNLKKAAKLGVAELLAVNTPTNENLRISLVPYNEGVNAGPLAKYVYPDYAYSRSDAPIYDARYDKDSDSYDSTVDTEGFGVGYDLTSHLESYYVCTKNADSTKVVRIDIPDGELADYTCPDGTPDIDYLPADFVIDSDLTNVDNCVTDRKEPHSDSLTNHQYTDNSPADGLISRDTRLSSCPSSPLVLLTSDQTTLDNALDGLSSGGFTAGHIGLQWAWYTLSHKWADYFDGTSSDPGDMSTDDELIKYIILMTDGQFNTAYSGTDSFSPASRIQLSKSHTASLCANIKAAGIKIFTIGYETPGSADTMLEACASPDEGTFTYSYEPNSAADLKATYQAIANQIRTLRLTQ